MQSPGVLKMLLRSGVSALGFVGVAGAVFLGVGLMLNTAAAATTAPTEKAADKGSTFEMFEDRGFTRAMRPGYQYPVSDWVAAEKAFYSKILAAGRFDVLVLPVMPRDYSFDRATRSLMTAQLAMAIDRAQKAKVADPFMVAKALGEGVRRIDLDAAYKLADDVGAKRVIWTFVGHNRKGKMAVSIQSQERPPEGNLLYTWRTSPVKKADFQDLPFTEESSPIEVFESLIPAAIAIIGGDPTALSVQNPVSKLDLAVLPDSPMKLIGGDDNPARDAYAFLLLARLVPSHVETTRERFAEKAFLATMRMSKESPEWRALRARAYLGLGYRPAAIAALGTPQTDEERALFAFLNGNLPAMSEASREANPLKRLLQRLDINSVAWDYGVSTERQSIDTAKAIKLPGTVWPYITTRALLDQNEWSQFGNAQLKPLLDAAFPITGYALEDLVRGSFAVGDVTKLQALVDMSVFNHGRKFIDASAARWCCRFSPARPDNSDYMELLQAIGHDNLVRKLHLMAWTQGRPEAAMNYANSIEGVYKGYPYYTLQRAWAEMGLARLASGVAVERLAKSSYQDATSAMLWEQTQSLVSGEAFDLEGELRLRGLLNNTEDVFPNNLYATDIPYHPAYPNWADGGTPGPLRTNSLAALANSSSILDPAQRLLEMDTHGTIDNEGLNVLMQSMEGRFIGSPTRSAILATIESKRGNVKAAVAYYRESVKASPAAWDAYRELGTILFRSGEAAEAAKVFRSYAGFKKGADVDRVAIANNAYEAGSMFYWSGDFDLAKPLYEISAKQNTGAAAEMTSALRLRLFAGDYAEAMARSLEWAQRYNNPYAYRDYLGMLFAMGHSTDAWSAFMVLAPQVRQPQIFEAATVGHRMDGASETEVVRWSRQSGFNGLGALRNTAAAALLRFAATDRVPSKELPAILDELDFATWAPPVGWVVRDTPAYGDVIVGLYLTAHGRTEKVRVKSDLAYFADGYRSLKSGEYAAAKAAFDEAATFYDMHSNVTSYALPYRAIAAAKTGDTASVEALMAQFKEAEKGFDYQLAKAALAAIGGRADEALEALKLARYRLVFTEDRPLLTQYTYGEICELLAALTVNSKIRQLALNWAKTNEVLEPWHAWTYAMEARLAKDARERQRALAMFYYLDPKSARLAERRKGEVNAAAKAWANPFREPSNRAKTAAAV